MSCKTWCGKDCGDEYHDRCWGDGMECWCSQACEQALRPLNPGSGHICLRYKLLADVPPPAYQTAGASGIDLCAAYNHFLGPGETIRIALGLAIEVPPGFEAQLRPRSSLSAIGVLFHFGTIDSDYRGEIMAVATNLSDDIVRITKGDRIAQLVIAPVARVELVRVEQLSDTTRGTGGFGSTGR